MPSPPPLPKSAGASMSPYGAALGSPASYAHDRALAQSALDLAQSREDDLEVRLQATRATLAQWDADAKVASVDVDGPGLVAVEPMDKRIYFVRNGAIVRAYYGPAAVLRDEEEVPPRAT